MAKIKKPRSMLATEHLLIRKRAKKSIFAIARLEGKGIAKLIEDMINNYLSDEYQKDSAVRKKYSIPEEL